MLPSSPFLTEAQWLIVQPMLAPPARGGLPHPDTRAVLEAIFWKLANNAPWDEIPPGAPSWQACYLRYHRWLHTGAWKRLASALMIDLHSRGGFDLLQALDSQAITFSRSCSGRFSFTYPPHLEGSWQLSTAFLLLVLTASE